MENETIAQAVQGVAPLLENLVTYKISRSAPEDSALRASLINAGEIAKQANLFEKSGQNYRLNPASVEALGNSKLAGIEFLTSMSNVLDEVVKNEDLTMSSVPEADRNAFRQNVSNAAVGLSECGIAIDARTVAAFGFNGNENRNNPTNVTEITARRVAPNEELAQIRTSTLDLLENIHNYQMKPGNTPEGNALNSVINNARESLNNAGYLVPGDSTARTESYSSQSERGSRENAEQVAAAGKLLALSLSDKNTREILIPEGAGSGAFTRVAHEQIGRAANTVIEACTTAENSGRAIIEQRKNSAMTVESANAAMGALISAGLVTAHATTGFNTEIAPSAESESDAALYKDESEIRGPVSRANERNKANRYARNAGALSSEAKRDFEEQERSDDQDHQFEPGEVADSAVMGGLTFSGEDGIYNDNSTGKLDSYEAMTRNDPSFSTVGTVYIAAKDFRALEDSLKLAKEAGVIDELGRMKDIFAAEKSTAAQDKLITENTRQAHEEYKNTDFSALTDEQKENLKMQIAGFDEENAASKEALTQVRSEMSQIPFSSEKDLNRIREVMTASEKVINSVSPEGRKTDPIVISEELARTLDGAVTQAIDNNSWMRMGALSGRSPREVENLVEERGHAAYATAQDAAAAQEGRFGYEDMNTSSAPKRPDQALNDTRTPKSEMSLIDYQAWRAQRTSYVSSRDIYEFDPEVSKKDGGLINLDEIKKTPKTAEDIALNRTDMERAFNAELYRPDGSVKVAFRDKMIGLTQNNKQIIVSPTRHDAEVIRAFAEKSQDLFTKEREEEVRKEAESIPKTNFVIKTEDVRKFLDQISYAQKNNTKEPDLAIRNNKLVIEHPEAKTIQGKSYNIQEVTKAQTFASHAKPDENGVISGYEKKENMPETKPNRAKTIGHNAMSVHFLEKLARSDKPVISIEIAGSQILKAQTFDSSKDAEKQIEANNEKFKREEQMKPKEANNQKTR